MADLVYFLCALTSGVCAYLLTRGYLRTREPLLFWSSCCFGCLLISNVFLVFDLSIYPTTIDLSMARAVPTFLGLAIMLYGLIWEVR